MIHFSFILRVGDNRQSGPSNVCDPFYCGGTFPSSSLLLQTRLCSGLHLLQSRREFLISRCSCTTAFLGGKCREESSALRCHFEWWAGVRCCWNLPPPKKEFQTKNSVQWRQKISKETLGRVYLEFILIIPAAASCRWRTINIMPLILGFFWLFAWFLSVAAIPVKKNVQYLRGKDLHLLGACVEV